MSWNKSLKLKFLSKICAAVKVWSVGGDVHITYTMNQLANVSIACCSDLSVLDTRSDVQTSIALKP